MTKGKKNHILIIKETLGLMGKIIGFLDGLKRARTASSWD